MKPPPRALDGADVLSWVSREEPFYSIADGDASHAVVAMAICRYGGWSTSLGRVYLFKCDREWNVIGDFDHDSIEEAMEAARQFGVQAGEWRAAKGA